MQKVSRIDLLEACEIVLPGIASRVIIDQSGCFVFKDKTVFTYNDELTCSFPVEVEIEGAVQAEPLVALLRKMTEEHVGVEVEDNHLVVKGAKSRKAGIVMESEILLPVPVFAQVFHRGMDNLFRVGGITQIAESHGNRP